MPRRYIRIMATILVLVIILLIVINDQVGKAFRTVNASIDSSNRHIFVRNAQLQDSLERATK